MNINDLLKVDKHGLSYLDASDVKIEPFRFVEIGKRVEAKRTFYKIDGIFDYLIKDTTMIPLLFNRTTNLNLLKNLINKQNELPEIGFPIGYYSDHGKMKGAIIPYYLDAISIRKLIYMYKFENLKEFYNHDNDDVDNLISLLLEILEIISKMQSKKVYYTDVNTGNFVIYNNQVKVIDFDPGFIMFKDSNCYYYEKILKNYAILVERVCHRLGFTSVFFNSGDTFIDAEQRVKSLKRELKGKYGI